MKIGILTFHNAHNYGAVLQCYALMRYLTAQGHAVSVIDYVNDSIISCYHWFDWRRFVRKNPLNILKEIVLLGYRKRRYNNFQSFINSLPLVAPYSIEDINILDYVVVGSDQVWNTQLTCGFDDWYWGNSVHSSHTRIVSYAASMEQYWGADNDVVAAELLKNFSSISVREQNLAEIIQRLIPSKSIAITIDPTLLISTVIWDKFAIAPKISDDYLLLYQVRFSEEVYNTAQDIAKRKGLRLVCLSARVEDRNDKNVIAASPREFIGLFKNASFIVTVSFHGTIFSVVFHREFLSLGLQDGEDSRCLNFLKEIGLENRFLIVGDSFCDNQFIDWDACDSKLDSIRKNSVEWINNNII